MDTLILPCTVEIQAAAGGDKAPRLRILGYAGGVTSHVLGWGAMAFDLAGMIIGGMIPVLAAHDDRIEGIVGQGRARVVGGRELLIEGSLSLASAAAQRVLELAQGGYEFQASIGLSGPLAKKFIGAGESVTVNGRTITAEADGFTLITKSTLREVSVLPVGADPQTAVEVAARAYFIKGVKPMLQPKVEATVVETPEQIQAVAALETARVDMITARAAHYTTSNPGRAAAIQAAAESATAGGATAAETEVALMRAARPMAPTPRMHSDDYVPSADVLASAWLIHAGKAGVAEKAYGPAAAQQASELRCHSSLDILAASLRAFGHEVPRGRLDLIRLAFSTNTASVMGSAVEKVAIARYADTPQTWRTFCAIKSVPSFRATSGIRPSFIGNLEILAPGGEVKHASLGEDVYPIQIHTEAKQLRLTREAVINDDLSLISEAGPAFGQMAARSLSDEVWETILANAGGHFAAGHNNLLTGGTSLMGIVAVTQAVGALRGQRSATNDDLDLSPAVLAVCPEVEMTARQVLESAEVGVAAGVGTGNPLKGLVQLVVEGRISNLAKFPTGAAVTAWYLFASPINTPVVVGFLDGKETPTVEFFGLDSDVDTLGVSWRVYHDFGAALADWRAGVRSNGA